MQWFIFTFLAIIFLVTPYQRGLYFTPQSYGIYFIILSLMLVLIVRHVLIKKETYSLKAVMIVILLPISYLVSLPTAESPRGAMDSLIKGLTYSSFFLLLYWVSFNPKIKKWLSPIFILTGTWISLFMLGIFYGFYDFHDAILNDRFAGVFQYPNTFAMVMVAFYLYVLILLTQKRKSVYSYLFYAFPLVPFLVSFMQANSRGMILLFPILWLVGLILLPVKRQVEYMIYSVITLACTLLMNHLMFTKNAGVFNSIAVILLSTGLILALKYILYRKGLKKRFFEKRGLQFVLPLCIIVFSIATFLDLMFKGLLFRMLPGNLQERIDGINLKAATAKERMIFFQDAFQMSKDSPFIGFGGESWKTIYQKYQQTPHLSNKVHNGYLEWLLDTGWIGFILFIIVFGYLFYLVLRSYKSKQDNTINAAVIVSLLTIASHSFIDFDLSYGTVWLMIMWLFVIGIAEPTGYQNQFIKMTESTQKRFVTVILCVFSIMILTGLIFSYRFMQATQLFNEAVQTRNLPQKIERFEKAIAYHPSNVNYLMSSSDFYLNVMSQNGKLDFKDELEMMAVAMVSLEPNNSTVLHKAALIYIRIGKTEEAMKLLEKGMSVDHYNTKLYEESMKLKLQMASEQSDQKDVWAKSVLKDYQQFNHWYHVFQEKQLSEAFNSRDFKLTPTMAYYAGVSYYLSGDYNQIIELYNQHPSIQKDIKMKALMVMALENEGDDQAIRDLIKGDEGKIDKAVEQLRGLFTQ